MDDKALFPLYLRLDDGEGCFAWRTLGPVSGHVQIQYFGIAGYAFVLPVACALLAMFFRNSE